MVYAGTQVAFETDSANTGLSTIYTWGPGVDNLIGMKVGTTNYTVVTDALGSVRALVRRDDGAWVGRLRYDPYGQLLDSAGPQPALRYRWTGREYDAETGFYFHRTRSYDPTVGRFVQEDRAGYSGGGNLYAYVNGDVLQATDPDGRRKAWTDAGRGFEGICTLGGSVLQSDGSVISGACNQYPGSGGAGGARALVAWGEMSYARFLLREVYKEYVASFEANNGKWRDSKELIPGGQGYTYGDLANGANEISWGQFQSIFNELTEAGARASKFGTNDDLRGFLLARFSNGQIFFNEGLVRSMNERNAQITYGYTFTNPSVSITILGSRALADVPFATIHESVHLVWGGPSDRHSERGIDWIVRQHLGRSSRIQ
jgi:RHS repeat-associated protein